MSDMFQMAPTSSWEDVKRTIEEELKMPIDDIFIEFEKKPISSASIAQVHKARLKSGENVAVKVQHHWLKQEIPIDIKMTEIAATIGKKIFKNFDYDWLVNDMKTSLPIELDFRIEAQNAKVMDDLFADNPQIKVPNVYSNFSTVKNPFFYCLVKDFNNGVCRWNPC